MRKKRAVGAGRSEDVTDKAGWMYADLFLALMVIFLATISFVPDLRTSPTGNTNVTPKVNLTSINMESGQADLYFEFDPVKIKSNIEAYKKEKGLRTTDEIIYVQVIGGYDAKNGSANDGTLNAISYSMKLKSGLPEYFTGAQFKLDTSSNIPAKSVALRFTFAPKVIAAAIK